MRLINSVFCLIVFSLVMITIATGANVNNMQVRIYFDSKEEILSLHRMHLDIVWREKSYIDIVSNPAELDKIKAAGYTTEIIHDDLELYYSSRMRDKAMGDYKTLDEINAYLDAIILAYPNIVSGKTSIGLTLEGRDIWAVKISDNPNIDEDEPEVLYFAAIHAREVATPEVLFYYIDYLTQNYGFDTRVNNLVNNREMWFILVANPDGYYHNQVIAPNGGGMWRKNRRNNGDGTYGVDLNRNFGYEWGFDDNGSSPYTSDPTYRGTFAFSEPEAQALRDFAISREFVVSMSYHSTGNLIIWPWGYDYTYAPDESIFATIGDSINSINGYAPGPIWTLYLVNGNTDDWLYGEQVLKNKTFAATTEVGNGSDGHWPTATRLSEIVAENLETNLYAASIAGYIYSLSPPNRPVLTVDDSVGTSGYTVYWSHIDTLNPAVEFELVELRDYQIEIDLAIDFDNWVNSDFILSMARYNSSPTSFFSGAVDNSNRFIRSQHPYMVQIGDSLRFRTWFDIETDWDYAYVEISTDGENYNPIPGNITTTSNPNGNNLGNGITGISVGGWVDGKFDLSQYVGQEVYFRLSYRTDGYVLEEGIYIDDVYPVGVFGVENSYGQIGDTFYDISGNPEGTHYYKVRAIDAQLQWSLFSNMEETAVVADYVCGDANSDGNINIADAAFIINYVFMDGATPNPLQSGDPNADGSINLADAGYLINYIFYSGAAPLCP